MGKDSTGAKRNLIDIIMMFWVCCFSLALLVYVAQGKATKTYEDFYRDATRAEGQLVRSAIESFLRLDLPLRQFAGFKALIEPVLANDPAIAAMTVLDDRGEVAFSSATQPGAAGSGGGRPDGRNLSGTERAGGPNEEIILPLEGKFENAGSVVLKLRMEAVSARVAADFWPSWSLVGGCAVAFALLTFAMRGVEWERKRSWTAAAFVAAFLGVAAMVTVTLIGLYADGASAKGRALLASLSGRLADVTSYKLNFDQIDGLDRVFLDYRRLNPDIFNIALVVDGLSGVDTDTRRVGHAWKAMDGTYEYRVDISGKDSPRSVQVAMTMLKDVVYRQIIHSVRNILALFVASGLFAYFSMNAARTLQEVREVRLRHSVIRPDIGLGLVKPIFFLGTFIDHINYSFLPKFVQDAVEASGVPIGYTSLPFIVYYICFAVSLIPAERLAFRHGPKKLIWGGLILAACGLLTLSGQFGFASIVVARALSGIGQGLLFIGVQNYILQTTPLECRTRGNSIIVLGFQAGMISGMAIGSLLVSQIGTSGIFDLGAGIAVAAALYTWVFLPTAAAGVADPEQRAAPVWRNIALTLRDPEFLRAIGLIGLPAKAVLTGVILFALPLLLLKQGFGQEDVGQITMMYATSVIAGSAWVASRAYRPHATDGVLVWGAVLSGAGLMLIASPEWRSNILDLGEMLPATMLIVAGVMAVGVGHGFINAPIVTQVTDSKISARLGAGPVAATYRLLERAGHTAGPVIVGQIMANTASTPLALGWIGVALIGMGLVFGLSCLGKGDGLEPEAA
jgi:MFS family permease